MMAQPDQHDLGRRTTRPDGYEIGTRAKTKSHFSPLMRTVMLWQYLQLGLSGAVIACASIALPLHVGAQLEGDGSGPFRLEPVRSWEFQNPHVPVIASVIDSFRMAWVAPDRIAVMLMLGDKTHEVSGFGMSRIGAIALGEEGVWVGAGAVLYFADVSSRSVRQAHAFPEEGWITSIARSDGRVWVTYSRDRRGSLFELEERGRSKLRLVDVRALNHSVSTVHTFRKRSVIVQDRSHPYSVQEVIQGSSSGWSFAPDFEGFAGFPPDTTRWKVGSAMGVGSDHLVQWFVDLGSANRVAVVSSISGSSVERVTEYRVPLGLIQSMRSNGQEFILGAQEIPGGRRLILYRLVATLQGMPAGEAETPTRDASRTGV